MKQQRENKKGLRADGKLKKGYYFKDGKIIKSTEKKCKEILSKKIGVTMTEYKKGTFKTPQQAIAVGYKIIVKEHPECKRDLKLKKK